MKRGALTDEPDIGTQADPIMRRNLEARGLREEEVQYTIEQTEAEAQQEEQKDERWSQPFGDARDKTEIIDTHIVRLITQNINTFPKVGTTKQDRLQHEVKNTHIIGMSELNSNWRKIRAQDSFYNRIKTWWRTLKTQMAWLQDPEWPSEFQRGGVTITVQGTLSQYVQTKGADAAGLGRWAWMTLEGRADTKTAIIQVYRPCKNEKGHGSVYNQHRAWTEESDPIRTFDKDLLTLIDEFQSTQHRIILMGDFNIQFTTTRSTLEQQLHHRNIHDPIRERYGVENAPNTHRRGSKPIDAIFASDAIEMIQGGYDAGYPELSDHRAIWMDITIDSILGIDRGIFPRPINRTLQAANPRIREKFNKEFERQLEYHNLVEKATVLEESAREYRTISTKEKEEMEVIDEQRCRAATRANQVCASRPSDDAAFSDKLQQALGMVIIASGMVRKIKKKKRIHTRWLQRMRDRWKIDNQIDIPKNLEEAKDLQTQQRTHLRETKAKAPELRRDFLDMLIRKAEDEGDEEKAKTIRIIRDHERIKEVHTRIKMAQGKLKGSGVKFVEIDTPTGNKRTIKDKNEMEAEIIRANTFKLQWANESPLRSGELQRILTDSDYDTWEQFLDKKIQIPEGLEEGTQRWLTIMQNMPNIDREVDITEEEYIRSWNIQREHTACAPGPMHFGTFKTMQWSQPAAKLHKAMANIPILSGYTPRRWKGCVDSMLPKKKDEWRPSKLRLTSLLAPDFNHNNKILGRRAVAQAEKANTLADEQYGSRKHLSAEKHALNKRLVLDILRVQRRPAVICANDAKSCYDRILHVAAYLSLRRAGIPDNATRSMLEPIRTMKHRIRTAYGDSQTAYGGDEWDRDPSGICQGNGAGPAIWLLVSSPLLQMLREAGYGAQLRGAIDDTRLHLAGFAYVDDADTIQTGDLEDDIATVVAKAQGQLDLWEEGIRATGGGIEGSKSDFAVLDFKWNNGTWDYAPKTNQHKLTVRSGVSGRENLTQLGVSEARRTLGVWQAIDGNENTQTTKMVEKATQWATNSKTGSLSRNDIAFGIKTSLYPSITYGLMATALDKQQCEEVFKPVRKHALGPMGYNRSIPATVVHGPECYGGMGIKDMHTIQGTAHITAILDEIHKPSPTGRLLNLLHQEHTLEIGRSGFLYDHAYAEIKEIMTDTWVKNTIQFMSEHSLRFQGQHPQLQTWRDGDSLLMDDFYHVPGHRLTAADIQAANRCRIYLQVNTRSDICVGNGTRILNEAWTVDRTWSSLSAKCYNWPRQPRPSTNDIRKWQKALHAAYGVEQNFLGWARRLGPWQPHTIDKHEWWYDRENDHLYRSTQGTWERWTKMIQRTRGSGYVRAEQAHEMPPLTAHPTIIILRPNSYVAYFHGIDRHTTRETRDEQRDGQCNEEQQLMNLGDALMARDESIQWAIERVKLPDDEGEHIASLLRAGQCEAICDGSLKEGFGTSAGFLKGVDDTHGYQCFNRVPGQDDDQSSYRSELCGILGHIIILTTIARMYNITEGQVLLGCDNESALWTAFGTKPIRSTDPCNDILHTIRHHVHQSELKWKYIHVEGHQDKNTPVEELDEWAKANVLADQLAKEFWEIKYLEQRRRPIITRMPGEGWKLIVGGHPVTQGQAEAIYNQAYYARCTKYWVKKGRILPRQVEKVDWSLYGETVKMTQAAKTQWTYKHFSGFEGTNYMLHKWGDRLDAKCPRCDKIEKHTHILRCQAPEAENTFQSLLSHYHQWLLHTTSTWLAAAIIETVEAYRYEHAIHVRAIWPEEIQHATFKQADMGPRTFVEGILHADWEGIQAQHLTVTHSRKNPRRWLKELIQKTWMLSWDMWDSRNGLVHGDTETRQQQIIKVLDAEITDLHDKGNANGFLPRVAKAFFATPLRTLMTQSEHQKRLWRRLGQRYLENDKKRLAQNPEVATLRDWLATGFTNQARAQTNRARGNTPRIPPRDHLETHSANTTPTANPSPDTPHTPVNPSIGPSGASASPPDPSGSGPPARPPRG